MQIYHIEGMVAIGNENDYSLIPKRISSDFLIHGYGLYYGLFQGTTQGYYIFYVYPNMQIINDMPKWSVGLIVQWSQTLSICYSNDGEFNAMEFAKV